MTKTTIDLAPAAEFLAFHTRKGQHLLCAVSGGLDSMCLLHFVSRWAAENGRTVTAAHFNHQLRENALEDEAFVRSWCAGRGIPFASGSGDVRSTTSPLTGWTSLIRAECSAKRPGRRESSVP